MSRYIYQNWRWPDFYWDTEIVLPVLTDVRNLQGRIMGQMEALGFEVRDNAMFESLSLEVLKSSEIEGELYKPEEVRSSVARKLGLDRYQEHVPGRNVDGIVDVMFDALNNCFEPLTKERLFAWQASLFPNGRSGMLTVATGCWRTDSTGPMQVVSGPMGREKVHFQAPHSDLVPDEMEAFLRWFNEEQNLDLVVKAAVAHLWFLTVHPFEDGNGRLARALTDLLLARSDKSTQQYYSLSAQIRKERNAYYHLLEKTQQGDLEVTGWVEWFLNCFQRALVASREVLETTLSKSNFWKEHAQTLFNERQLKMVNLLHDGFDGKLTTSKWAKICKCSADTALRDVNDLLEKDVLVKNPEGGRSTSYLLK